MIEFFFKRCIGHIAVMLFPMILILVGVIYAASRIDSYNGDEQQKIQMVFIVVHTAIPLVRAWWTVIFHKNIIQDEGNELYRLYYKRKDAVITELLLHIYFMLILFGFMYLTGAFVVSIDVFLYIQVFTESICLASVCYMVCYLIGNVGAAFIIVSIYAVFINLFDSLGLLGSISIYPVDSQLSIGNVSLVAISGGISILTVTIGIIADDRINRFN